VPIPSDFDGDPNGSKIALEMVIRFVSDTAMPAATPGAVAARIASRTGVTPKAVAIAADNMSITVTMPDTGQDAGFWVAWLASAVATLGRTGVVQSVGSQARVSA
jgi:hypothetical protein